MLNAIGAFAFGTALSPDQELLYIHELNVSADILELYKEMRPCYGVIGTSTYSAWFGFTLGLWLEHSLSNRLNDRLSWNS